MKFLVYSEVNAANIASSLGLPEYSYYFVLKEFLPVLRRLGEVVVVHDPRCEVDALYHQALERGQRCVFLSFSPPHKTVLGLVCPTIPVFAWEFDSIPSEAWCGQPEQDWRYGLKRFGRAIVHSKQTERSVKDLLGEGYPVVSIPAPVWDRLDTLREVLATPRDAVHTIRVRSGVVVDTREFDLTPYRPGPNALEEFVAAGQPKPVVAPVVLRPAVPRPNLRQILHASLRYFVEWYRLVVRDLLPVAIREVLGRLRRWLVPGRELPATDSAFEEQAVPSPVPAADSCWVPAEHTFNLDGVVFTSVFNPYDGRKNWSDILTAFCTAFRDNPEATLLFKLTHQEYRTAIEAMLSCMARLPAFRCRVVILHGYLELDDYNTLVAASDFVVNASHGEGQCLPLMEMLSCGIPAIAPRNSAMLDYIDTEVGFVVNSWLDGTAWPHDPRLAYRTRRHQLDWASLCDAFRAAYQCFREQPEEYRRLSSNAIERMRRHCSQQTARQQLVGLLKLKEEVGA